MKVRAGFVSNSSSSSFTCTICGHTESGWDIGFSDIGFCCCQYGHTMCQEHWLKEIEYGELDVDELYEMPPEDCPICQLKHVRKYDVMRYLVAKIGAKYDDIVKEIQGKYNSLQEFNDDIK